LILLSLPSRECGLKLFTVGGGQGMMRVTPLAGVWIEMPYGKSKHQKGGGHSPRGSVD